MKYSEHITYLIYISPSHPSDLPKWDYSKDRIFQNEKFSSNYHNTHHTASHQHTHTHTATMQSYKDIDISAIKMDNKVNLKNSSHGVLIKLVQGNGSPVIFQTPLMSLAWDTRVREAFIVLLCCYHKLNICHQNITGETATRWFYHNMQPATLIRNQ